MRCGAYCDYGSASCTFTSAYCGSPVAAASAAEPAACITLHLLISIHTRRGLTSQKGAASAHQGGEKGGRAPSPQCAVWVK